MAVNINPVFTLTPNIGIGRIDTASASTYYYTGLPTNNTTTPTVYTAGSNGSRVERVLVKSGANAATSPGLVRVFIYDTSNTYLWTEIAVTAVTPSTTVAGFETEYTPLTPLVLPASYKMVANCSVIGASEILNVEVFGGDF